VTVAAPPAPTRTDTQARYGRGWNRVLVVHGHRDRGHSEISRECLRRVRRAQRELADVVIFSGANGEAEQMALAGMRGGGHPETAVILEDEACTTEENALYSALIALRYRPVHVVVVSSWWHCPRLWWYWRARSVGFSIAPSRGSLRYLPGELLAVARAIWRGWHL
jgi:uncharacterized SAM-binding protein YcdF (DUF218 family)